MLLVQCAFALIARHHMSTLFIDLRAEAALTQFTREELTPQDFSFLSGQLTITDKGVLCRKGVTLSQGMLNQARDRIDRRLEGAVQL